MVGLWKQHVGVGSAVKTVIVEEVSTFRENTWPWGLQNISTQMHANPHANAHTIVALASHNQPTSTTNHNQPRTKNNTA